ncbi:hypothetical protein [Geodermatophilus sp. URMC 64]
MGAVDRDGAGPVVVRRRVVRRLALWMAGSAVGVAVIAVPDTGPRVFSLSAGHGPSALDLLGVVVVVAAWLPVPLLLCSRSGPWRGAAGRVVLAAVVVGVGLLWLTITRDLGAWWLLPVAFLVGVQVVGLGLMWSRGRRG